MPIVGHLIVVLLASLFSAGGSWFVTSNYYQKQIAELKLDEAKSITQGVKDALKVTVDLQRRKDAALAEASKRNAITAADLADSRAELERLRSLVPEAGSSDIANATRASLDAYAATLGVVFTECSAQYQTLGGNAQGHASDSLTLQMSWPKN